MKAPSLKQDALFSIGVSVLPSLIGLVAIPFIIHNMGLERLAFLSLIWALAGYFGILDLGLGRSLSKRTSFRHANAEYSLLEKEITFGLSIVLLLSLFVALVFGFYGQEFFRAFARISSDLLPEAQSAIIAVSFSLPFVMTTTAIKGVLEGLHSFKEANWIQIASGLSNFIIPWVVSSIQPDLFSTILWLSISRAVLCALSLYLLLKKLQLRWSWHWDSTLLFDGGWLTVSAISSPVMVYIDRFILTSMIPLKTLAFYTTPVDLASRLSILPQGISRVSFPTFSYFKGQNHLTLKSFTQSLEMMILFCLPAFIFVNFFAGEILRYWISPEMEANGRVVLMILTVGLFWNSLGWSSYSLLQATDKTRLAALIAVCEIPFYLVFLIWASKEWGYLGAGAVWSIRFIADALIVDTYFLLFNPMFKNQILRKLKISILFTCVALISWISIELGTEYRVIWGFCLMAGISIFLFRNRSILDLLRTNPKP